LWETFIIKVDDVPVTKREGERKMEKKRQRERHRERGRNRGRWRERDASISTVICILCMTKTCIIYLIDSYDLFRFSSGHLKQTWNLLFCDLHLYFQSV
jgi:hypothetical protein